MAVLGGGCGPSESLPAHEQVIPQLSASSGGAGAREPVVVEAYELAQDHAAWSVEAPFKKLERRPDPPVEGGPTHELILSATQQGERIQFSRRGEFDPARFNRIWLPMRFDGQGSVRADFLRGSKLVGRTETVRIQPTSDQAVMSADDLHTELRLPPSMRFEEPFDTLQLHVPGVYRLLALSHVLLVQESPEGMLPQAGGGGELLRVGLEARRGVGLFAGEPLTSEIEVPEGADLRFALGQPVVELRSQKELRVDVSANGKVIGEYELLELPEPDGKWHEKVLDLSSFGGQSVQLSFELIAAEEGQPVGCALAGPTLVVPDAKAPTVLLITSDTHRADHVGFAAEGVSIATPVLDALAARGTVFEDCFAPVNVTNPSHVSLMTARSLRTTGVRTNFSRLSDAAPTLAEAFSEAGWMTMAAVSTRHLGADGSGLGQGFDSMSWPRFDPRRRAEVTLADVMRWLPAAEGRPLFLWLHVFDAHWPYEPESDWVDRYYPADRDPRDPSLPKLAVDPGRFKSDLKGVRDLDWPRAQYKAEISGQDALLNDLLERPRFRNGVVAFVSDHGESLGEQGVFFDHVGLYPSVLHIPLVLAGPGVPVGKRSDRPVMHTDLGRTLLDLAGLQDVPFPGADLLTSNSIEPRFAIEGYGLSASMTHNGLHLVLNLSARNVESVLQSTEHHEVELYDLSVDPNCRNNLIEDRFEIAETMRARLVEWLGEVPDRGWAEQREDDPAVLESLRQLGYMEPTQNVSARLWQPDECTWCQRFGE